MPYSTLRPLKGFDDHATWRLRTRLWHNKKSWTQCAEFDTGMDFTA